MFKKIATYILIGTGIGLFFFIPALVLFNWQPATVHAFSQTTFGPGGINHAGSEIAMVDANGNVTVIHCPPDSTITVQTLRTAPDPSVSYTGTSAAAASSAVQGNLESDGAQQ